MDGRGTIERDVVGADASDVYRDVSSRWEAVVARRG